MLIHDVHCGFFLKKVEVFLWDQAWLKQPVWESIRSSRILGVSMTNHLCFQIFGGNFA